MNPDIQCVVQSADILGEAPCGGVTAASACGGSTCAAPRCNPMIPPPAATRRSAPARNAAGRRHRAAYGGRRLRAGHQPRPVLLRPASGLPPQAVVDPESDKPGHRLNDGKCDRRGRFCRQHSTRSASLPARYTASTGPSLPCHARRLRAAQCAVLEPRRLQHVFRRHAQPGDLGLRLRPGRWRDLEPARLQGLDISPAVPMAPRWTPTAMYGTAWSPPARLRLAPDGRVDRVIQLPVNSDLPAFGGAGLDTLYITSHSQADAGKTGAGTAGRRPVRAERGRERPAGTHATGADAPATPGDQTRPPRAPSSPLQRHRRRLTCRGYSPRRSAPPC